MAKEKIMQPFGLMEQLIMSSAQSLADMRELRDSAPLEIARYFIATMIKNG